MRLPVLSSAATLLFAVASQAQEDVSRFQVQVLPLHYRMASEVLPALLPLLEGRGAAIGSGDQIFVRATPEALHDVQAMVSLLDVQPRRVRLVVRQVFTKRQRGAPSAADAAAGRALANQIGTPFAGFASADVGETAREGAEAPIRIRRDEPLGKARTALEEEPEPAIVDDWYFGTLGRTLFLVPHLLENDFVSVEVVTRAAGPDAPELRTAVEGSVGRWIDVTRVLESHASRRTGPEDERHRDNRTDNVVLVRVERIEAPQ
jgi:hypothetical protein